MGRRDVVYFCLTEEGEIHRVGAKKRLILLEDLPRILSGRLKDSDGSGVEPNDWSIIVRCKGLKLTQPTVKVEITARHAPKQQQIDKLLAAIEENRQVPDNFKKNPALAEAMYYADGDLVLTASLHSSQSCWQVDKCTAISLVEAQLIHDQLLTFGLLRVTCPLP